MEQIEHSSSVDIAKLVAEHRALDARVTQLEHQAYLTAEEEREMQELKKLKLQKKDQIQGFRPPLTS